METKITIKKIIRRITYGHDYLREGDKREEFRLCAERIIKENSEADIESLYVLTHYMFSRILNFLFVIVFLRKNCLFDKQQFKFIYSGHKILQNLHLTFVLCRASQK